MKILIDGENFRHQIAYVLEANGNIADKHSYFPFDWSGFLAEATGSTDNETTYYTTKIKQPHNPVSAEFERRIAEISAANRRQIADLTNQGIHTVKAGNLKLHKSYRCENCGHETLMLQEKGVDVRVAIDLLLASATGAQEIVLVSSDSDLIPALDAVKGKESNVVYLCYVGWLNRAVSASVYKTLTFDDNLVVKYYKGK
jgi:uncharacterized LabA/DUF88 family protein